MNVISAFDCTCLQADTLPLSHFNYFLDNWLKQILDKPKKKAKSRTDSPSVQFETGLDALVAAGLLVNSLDWNQPTTTVSTAVKATPIAESCGE